MLCEKRESMRAATKPHVLFSSTCAVTVVDATVSAQQRMNTPNERSMSDGPLCLVGNALDHDHVRISRCPTNRFELRVVLGPPPLSRGFHGLKANDDDTLWIPVALQTLGPATPHQVFTTVLADLVRYSGTIAGVGLFITH